ncbi:MBL fold metallo-hydrolase [Nocardiopsis xinjiangensis]|uniref:MBL fold metallo-hydrolase n=1 Tax=Nocardiopsis xinjiangensis TaxID=124285 RepID=UPI000348F35D|nr:MBL fold metallo-hydrolase [Nocardiopsis xinjiangensis]
MGVQVNHTVTSGTFTLDGATHDVDNNVWVVGDDRECLVIDAPHEIETILDLVDGRSVRAVLCTHAHDDHVRMAPALADAFGAPVLLHPDDRVLWDLTHPDRAPDGKLTDGQVLEVGDVELRLLHTPGHAPGSVCVYVPALGTVFTGDTLFAGGPGATGRSYSDFGVIVESIRHRLLPLPEETVVNPGHGGSTTIGAVRTEFEQWAARGY